MDDLFSLKGKVAIVTGASSGLGQRFTHVLHGAGARVVAAARRRERLEALGTDLGDRVLPVACDITSDRQLEDLVAEAVRWGGGVDVLVNNAGVSDPMSAEDETPEHFRQVVAVNLTASFVLSRLVAALMVDRGGGSIVNIASMFGLVASTPVKDASYAASKGGLVNLTRELAAQWARRGVRVNAIAPGWFPSEMTDEMFADPKSREWMSANAPIGRPGELHELDGALLFLAGAASTYVIGHVLAVDGGWTAR